MSENIQPSSEDTQIVENLAKVGSSEKLQEFKDKDLVTNVEQNRFECRSCGYIYDPLEGNKKLKIPKNTPFSEIDGNTFACPVCRAGKNLYKDIGPREKPSGFEENLTYGFGFNSLPPGQKNILIFGGLAFAAACFLSLYSLH